MNEKYAGGCYIIPKPSLVDLKEKLTEINAHICSAKHWGLSEETTAKVMTELETQKIEIKMQMIELINQL